MQTTAAILVAMPAPVHQFELYDDIQRLRMRVRLQRLYMDQPDANERIHTNGTPNVSREVWERLELFEMRLNILESRIEMIADLIRAIGDTHGMFNLFIEL